MANIYGGLIRELRRAKGMSQQQLADECQVSPRTVHGIESSTIRKPQPPTREALHKALGLDVDLDSTDLRAVKAALLQAHGHESSVPGERRIEILVEVNGASLTDK